MDNINEINEIIKKIKKQRERLNLSYQELSNKTGFSASTLHRYETGGIKNIKIDNLLKIAEALELSPAYLMGWEDLGNGSYLMNEQYISYSTKSNKIIVYGKICAGNGKTAYEDIIDEIICPYPRAYGNMIGLQVDGESMNKVVKNGDYAIIKMQPEVENGQIAAVMIENEEAMLKRFYRLDDETVVLKPESTEDFKPIIFSKEQINKIKIIGKFIGYVSPYVE
jgi:repressor LexA